MKDILFWTGTIGAQLIIYLLPSISLPKGKWIRKKDTAATSLSISVETMPYGQSKSSSREVQSESKESINLVRW